MSAATRTRRSSRDLIKEPDIGVVQNPDVRDVVPKHGDARRAHTERPAGVFVSVETRGVDDRWMHHSRAENFHPAGALAAGAAGAMTELALDIHLSGWLGEREVAR